MASYRNIKFDGAHTLITQPEVHVAGNSDLTWRFTAVRNFVGTHVCDKVEFFMDGERVSTGYWTKMETQDFINEMNTADVYYVDHSKLPLAS